MERKQSGQPQTEEDIYRKISDMAEEQRDELIQLRRDFHRYPETSWLEMRTSAKIGRISDRAWHGSPHREGRVQGGSPYRRA